MGIPGVKTALRALHGISSSASAFLHHHGGNQILVFGDPMLHRIEPDQGAVCLHLRAHGNVAAAPLAAAGEHGRHAHDDHKRNDDQHEYPGSIEQRPLAGGDGFCERRAELLENLAARLGRFPGQITQWDRGRYCVPPDPVQLNP